MAYSLSRFPYYFTCGLFLALATVVSPTPVLLPGKFHGWRRLVGYSPWGHKELDMTEQQTLSLSLA